jgi:phasin
VFLTALVVAVVNGASFDFMPHCNIFVATHKFSRYIGAHKQTHGPRPPRGQIEKGLEMAKTAERTADVLDNIEFPAFDASKATEQLRTFTEKSVEQSKEAYAKLKTGAEDAQKALETTFETAKSVGSDLSLKTIAALRANADAGFSHLEALVGAKSLSEVVELQTSFFRARVETAVDQAKDFQVAAQKAAEDVSKPLKSVFEKTFKDIKVA